MSIGTGIVLFVIGAVLAFAINLDNPVVDLDLIGYILMGAGFVVFVIGLVFLLRKRQSTTTVTSGVGANGEAVQQRSTSSNDSPIVPPTA
jgi:membrane-bound ClpP family serine protease